jgi:CRISPR-associated protein Cmr3
VSVWLIEPLDPLIARDGRPAAVGRFSTVGFPYPSMTAGAVRTRMGSEGGAFVIPKESLGELRENVIVRGPLLAEMAGEKDEISQWLAPAPRDAVFLEDAGKVNLKRLAPRPLRSGEAMDSLLEKDLAPLRFHGGETYGKPPAGIPAFWNWKDFETWLVSPRDRRDIELQSLGAASLPVERRAHLAIQPGERVGIDGMLFQTAGLRFLQNTRQDGPSFETRRFALSVWCRGGHVAGRELALRPQIAPLGGERRLARWSPALHGWPEMPAAIREKIAETGRARLALLTPAVFEQGALPGWNGGAWPLDGSITVNVRAAAVPRPEVVSGWDLFKGRPKRSRRLAPAGSVYFVELNGSPEDRRRWCDETWLACVSDGEQDRRDGFGLVALGTREDEE